jgi:hypothetical protein
LTETTPSNHTPSPSEPTVDATANKAGENPAAEPSTQQQPADTKQTSEAVKDAPVDASKASESKDGDPSKENSKEPSKDEAPETFEFTAPEGKALNPEVSEEFKALAKELGIGKDKAQKVVDLGFKLESAFESKMQSTMQQARQTWLESSKSDKEFGGSAFDQNLGIARSAMKEFGTPELQALLNQSGLGNHPEIIRAFYKAGKKIQEQPLIRGSEASQQRSIEERLYPNQKKEK